jgi:dihydroorotate dehydrogenase
MVVGAAAVQIGTANFYRPGLSKAVVDDCLKFAREQGLNSWEELRWKQSGS